MSEATLARLHATVEGRVQGVGFRYFVIDNAAALDLNGWVRNRWNGTVEVVAEGSRPALEKLLAALHRGPNSSHVSNVQFGWEAASGEFLDFHMRNTD